MERRRSVSVSLDELSLKSIESFGERNCGKIKRIVGDKQIKTICFDHCICPDNQYERFSSLLLSFASVDEIRIIESGVNLSRILPVFERITSFTIIDIMNQELYDSVCEIIETCKQLKKLTLHCWYDEVNERFPMRILHAISKSNLDWIRIAGVTQSDKSFLNHMKEVGDMVESCRFLRSFSFKLFYHQEVVIKDWTLFCKKLSQSRSLELVDLSNNRLTKDQTITLFDEIGKLLVLMISLRLSKEIIPSFSRMMNRVKSLDIHCLSCDDVDTFMNFAREIAENRRLMSLTLNIDKDFDIEDGETLGKFDDILKTNGSITLGQSDVFNYPKICSRNKRSRMNCHAACVSILAAKKFRQSPDLQTMGRDITTLLSKHLLQTKCDVDTWTNRKQ